jgi:hypothetical protein
MSKGDRGAALAGSRLNSGVLALVRAEVRHSGALALGLEHKANDGASCCLAVEAEASQLVYALVPVLAVVVEGGHVHQFVIQGDLAEQVAALHICRA